MFVEEIETQKNFSGEKVVESSKLRFWYFRDLLWLAFTNLTSVEFLFSQGTNFIPTTSIIRLKFLPNEFVSNPPPPMDVPAKLESQSKSLVFTTERMDKPLVCLRN